MNRAERREEMLPEPQNYWEFNSRGWWLNGEYFGPTQYFQAPKEDSVIPSH